MAIFIIALLGLAAAQDQPFPCLRWATAAAVGGRDGRDNGTLWLHGGRYRSKPGQTSQTWTNDLLALDLNSDWPCGTPKLELLATNGISAPALALGALWASSDGRKLYQWGGESSDTPVNEPPANNLYSYDIDGNSWSIVSTNGDNTQRAAEGAAAIAPGAGTNSEPLAFYAFGHIDYLTSPDWSINTPRIYLNSMLAIDLGSFTYTNYSTFNPNQRANSGNSSGVAEAGPTFRADSTLTYVPGLGTDGQGVLVSIGGGNDNLVIDNSALDVFDIGSLSWVKQATSGDIPTPRVNHCAARGTANINGKWQSQIFIYGGQNTAMTEQYTDVYVLNLPTYEWYNAGSTFVSEPVARAGHTCTLVGSQLVIVGGYVSDSYLCDSQPVYILDVQNMAFTTTYDSSALVYKTPKAMSGMLGGSGEGTSDGTEASSSNYGSGSGYAVQSSSPIQQTPSQSTSIDQLQSYTSRITKTFTSQGQTYTTTFDSTYVASATATNGAENDPGALQSSTYSSNLRAIIGGAVGGILGLGLIGAAVFLFLKRQKRRETRHHRLLDATEDDSIFDPQDSPYNDWQQTYFDGKQGGAYTMATIVQTTPSWPASPQRSSLPTSSNYFASTSSRQSGSEESQGIYTSAPIDNEGLDPFLPAGAMRLSLRMRRSNTNSSAETPNTSVIGVEDYELQSSDSLGKRLFPRGRLKVANRSDESESSSLVSHASGFE